MSKYVIGIDFGTLSGRAILMDVESGKEIAESTLEYAHGVMDVSLPLGKKLPPSYALQHPEDYVEVLETTVACVMKQSGVSVSDVVGLGVDFTSCTLIPVDENMQPLCYRKEYWNEPHAYAKLWKHHGAQPEADLINSLAKTRGEKWLPYFGGRISSEWVLPKVLEILHDAPEIYEETYRFLEAGEWITYLLCGNEVHNPNLAGFKNLWTKEYGFPSNDFFAALDPRLSGIMGTKLGDNVGKMSDPAGKMNSLGACLTGLQVGTAISTPLIDAHSAIPALNMVRDGDMTMTIGTSSGYLLNTKESISVDGICATVGDGLFDGLYIHEAGQSAVGDIFAWFTSNCVPEAYEKEARERNISIHKLLREKAKALHPGESGLLALDWHNGNRSVLDNGDLSGLILGLTLQTRPEEIYRALIESVVFGTKVIFDRFEERGAEIRNVCAAGGIAQKDEMMMQIYADVLNRPIRIAGTKQACARGAAINATVAAGIYPDIFTACDALALPDYCVYYPNPDNREIYGKLFAEYKTLHDYFGTGVNQVMERLTDMKRGG
ncbi:MAG: ribulokinase [Clostridia bacterium]|nr:ribulokinase [Clostridia bacterium]